MTCLHSARSALALEGELYAERARRMRGFFWLSGARQ